MKKGAEDISFFSFSTLTNTRRTANRTRGPARGSGLLETCRSRMEVCVGVREASLAVDSVGKSGVDIVIWADGEVTGRVAQVVLADESSL